MRARNSIKRLVLFLSFVLFFYGGISMEKPKDDIKGKNIKDTAIFTLDKEKNEIISLSKNVNDYFKLKFISVTTDQSIYWLNEEVFLKILIPTNPSQEIKITLQKKDSTPRDLGKFTLNDGGILVQKILSGKEKKLEPGEYRVDVETTDKKLQSYTSFTIVEGALGAVSFAHDFQELTNPKALEEVKGGWFLGNAAGVGMRWGNGLNVKNEIRVFNQPFTGSVKIKSRCFLPGCNGIEAGPEIAKDIKDGLLEATLNVSSHSGPFEIEVITDKGSVKNLFSRSGHIERQSIPISSNLTNYFQATLAPYEGTTAVYGRDVYIMKSKDTKKDAFELVSPICGESGEIEIIAKKEIVKSRIFVLYPEKSDEFKTEEIKCADKIKEGEKIQIKCSSPYSFIAIGGFLGEKSEYYEGWAIVFAESPIKVEILAPQEGTPLKSSDIEIKTFDRFKNKPVSMYGILEVFDNRVSSKSPKDPLSSATGDSFRGLSNYLSTWRDITGITMEQEMVKETAAPSKAKIAASISSLNRMAGAAPPMTAAPGQGIAFRFIHAGEEIKAGETEIQETIREGEKKVIYCDVVKTDENGRAKITVELPPQTGRCKIRFVAISKFDYLEKVSDIDVKKGCFVELNLQPLLIPGAKIFAKAHIVNSENMKLKLNVFGAGLDNILSYDIEESSKDIEFEVLGKNYGPLKLELIDSTGKTRDRREIEIKNISSLPVTFSDVIISDGGDISIEKGKRIAVYSNPAGLLQGIIMNITTTMYSWFGHSEAISASAGVRAILLGAIEDKIINDEGMRETLKSDLIKSVKDLYEKFYNKEKGLMCPYPGIEENVLWSVWVARNLNTMLTALLASEKLKEEFKDTITIAGEMIEKILTELDKGKISIEEIGFFDPKLNGVDLIPIEVDGKVVYKAVTDMTVVNWFVNKMLPTLDLPHCKGIPEIDARFIKSYDIYRFLRAFERTGSIYYLLLNAKALYLNGDKNFFPVFNKIARGMILTQEPGLIQGPALLGGVYSSPQTMIKFLELLTLMATDEKIKVKTDIEITKSGNVKETLTISTAPAILDATDGAIKIKAPEFVTIRIDDKKEINLYDYLETKSFFTISVDNKTLKMGEEAKIQINLDKDKDPSEYYAIVAVPSVMSVRQTEDLLSDYKGQLLYGQRASGGQKIQLLSVPFRGSRTMILNVEAAQKGESEGFILVRHISNPDIIVTEKIEKVTVE